MRRNGHFRTILLLLLCLMMCVACCTHSKNSGEQMRKARACLLVPGYFRLSVLCRSVARLRRSSCAFACAMQQPVRSRSDQTLDHGTRGKRAHDECVSLRLPRHPSDDDSDSDSGSGGEDSAGLGAPPLLPPTLKRARACSFSPSSSTAKDFADFSKKISLGSTPKDTPRQ